MPTHTISRGCRLGAPTRLLALGLAVACAGACGGEGADAAGSVEREVIGDTVVALISLTTRPGRPPS